MTEIILIVPLLFMAVVLHECAHGWVAYRLGDPTAKEAGRLTLNPLKHIDPVGTVLIPGILIFLRMMGQPTFLFGWAKPVPVDYRRLKNPKQDMIWVALAGPAVNFTLALVFAIILRLPAPPIVKQLVEFAIMINLVLLAFNMLPVPPLDGSRLVMGLLPPRLAIMYAGLERYGIFIVFILLYLGVLDLYLWPVVGTLAHLLGVRMAL